MKYVGKSIPRIDGIDKVTGIGKFIADIKLPNMLYIKLLRSDYAHALIKKINTKKAEKIKGVVKVVTCTDKDLLDGSCIYDRPPLAVEKVRYVGEPVAAVVAENLDAALEGVEAIEVSYKELKPVFDQREAMKKDAPIIHERLKEYSVLPCFHPKPGTNIFHHYKGRKGNTSKAFKKADLILENEFSFPHISHVQLEPHGTIAQWDEYNKEMHIWSSCQSPFFVKNAVAHLFKLPKSKVNVTVPYLGGGFGGKSDVVLEPTVCYIAMQVPNRPVRLILDREEMFFGSLIGRGAHVKIKTGVTKNGKIVAEEIDMAFSCGAYGDTGINVVEGGGHNATGPYFIPDLKIDSYAVYTNKPYIGAFRGYGHPEVHWAVERHFDLIAEKLGMDYVEFRLKNILRPGDSNAFGQIMEKNHGQLENCIKQTYDKIKKLAKKKKPKDKYKKRGIGIAAFMKSPVMATNASSCCILKFNEDCTVNLSISGTDMGQGALTVLSQIAAETLKFDFNKIHIARTIDSQYTPYEWQTVGSTTTWKVGNAIVNACKKAIDEMKKLASVILGGQAEDYEYDGKKVYLKRNKNKFIPIEELVMGYVYPDGHAVGGPIITSGYYTPEGLTYADEKTGQGQLAAEWTFGCQGAEVEVDLRTGKVDVLNLVTSIDAGQVVNPVLAHGQITGAMVQGFGSALFEEIIYDDKGKIRNSGLTDYKIPTPGDVYPPKLEVNFISTPLKNGPYGARCIAEHAIVSIPPAIGNAIYNAAKINIKDLPITAEKILLNLRRQGE